MPDRRAFLGATVAAALLPGAALARSSKSAANALPESSAMKRMNELGPENAELEKRVGLWDTTETVWASPGAPPMTTTGLLAERRMYAPFLQEFLRPASDPSGRTVARIDYLSFNRVEGRYEYVSMDTRASVGLMTAQSFARGNGSSIDVVFQPFAFPAPGTKVVGEMLRMTESIIFHGPDRDEKTQHFLLADGTGTRWLAHRYAYVRRK